MVIYCGEKGTVVLYRLFFLIFLIIFNTNYVYANNPTSEVFDNILNNYQATIKNENNLENEQIYIFISFSMGDNMLKNYFIEANKLQNKMNITFVLRGFFQNSFQLTIKKIGALLEDIGPVSIIVDPTLFLKYDVKQVPVIVQNGKRFKKISGAVSIQYSLEKFLGEEE